MTEPESHLSDRDFDAWLSAADPWRNDSVRDRITTGRLRQHWSSCTTGRRRRLATCRRCAAAGLLLAVFVGVAALHATRSDKLLTKKTAAPEASREPISADRPSAAADVAEVPPVPPTVKPVPPTAKNDPANPAASEGADRWLAAMSAWSARLDRVSAAVDGHAVTTRDRQAWWELVAELRSSSPAEPQVLVAITPYLDKPAQQAAAVALIAEAGQGAAVAVLERWLLHPSLHSAAFDQLTRIVADRDLPALAAVAQTAADRDLFCRRLVESRGVEIQLQMLLALAADPDWRGAVHRASTDLPVEAVDGLLTRIGDGSSQQRAAAAFLISAIRRERVDRLLAHRVLSGRGRHAAYLALLARPTDDAKLFLATAARRWDLSPGLHAARQRWSRVRPIAEQWSEELRGDDNARQPENTSAEDSADGTWLAMGRSLRPASRISGRGPA